MSYFWVSLLSATFLFVVSVNGICTNGDDMTCSLGGECINNKCVCQSTWTGENCEILNLLPSNQYKAFYRSTESSWGGSVIYSSNDSLYHMFVADMSYNCSLKSWGTNSRIIHVTSKTADGPYSSMKNIVVNIFGHNPTIQQNPINKQYVIYHIGYGNQSNGQPINCTTNYTYPPYNIKNEILGFDNNTYPNRAYSMDLNNKNWTILTSTKGVIN